MEATLERSIMTVPKSVLNSIVRASALSNVPVVDLPSFMVIVSARRQDVLIEMKQTMERIDLEFIC